GGGLPLGEIERLCGVDGVGVGAHLLLRHLAPDEIEQLTLLITQELLLPGGIARFPGRRSAADVAQLAQRAALETERPGVPIAREVDRATVRRPRRIGLGRRRLREPPLRTRALDEPEVALQHDDLAPQIR